MGQLEMALEIEIDDDPTRVYKLASATVARRDGTGQPLVRRGITGADAVQNILNTVDHTVYDITTLWVEE